VRIDGDHWDFESCRDDGRGGTGCRPATGALHITATDHRTHPHGAGGLLWSNNQIIQPPKPWASHRRAADAQQAHTGTGRPPRWSGHVASIGSTTEVMPGIRPHSGPLSGPGSCLTSRIDAQWILAPVHGGRNF
jgi:hypothetical protein